MHIEKIEIENWKCFLNKKVFKFDKHMLISKQNGTGKTSIMQAIEYSIFGKQPVGFNLNSVRKDPNKPCRIYIEFVINDNGLEKIASIERIFGSTKTSSNICELKIDNVLICESVRTVFDYMNKLLNQKITSQLWTNSLITSDILDSRFYTKNIIDDILEDPIKLITEYKSRVYSKNRKINGFKEIVLDIDKIKKEIENIQSKLKESPKNESITLARSAKSANDKIEELKRKINFENLVESNSIPSIEDCRKFNRIYRNLESDKKKLIDEEAKEDNIYSKFSKREIENILSISEELGKCIICGKVFNEKHKEKTIRQLEKCGRSEKKINDLKNEIQFIESMDKTIVDAILEINSLELTVKKCPNYDEIINSYDENNNKLWEEFNKLQKDLTIALRQQEELNKINKLKLELEKDREKLKFLNDYIENATIYHTNKLLTKASSYLNSINNRYKQICLYEGDFHVIVENNESFALDLLPVARLSNGEKTMCALSLIFSMHNLMTPELPLIFDETFASLDHENLEQVKKFLRLQKQTQIFVITHDTTWNEF